MLYQMHEFQRVALEPLRLMAGAQQQFLQNPFNPVSYLPPARAMSAAFELFDDVTRAYGKPAFGLDRVTDDGIVYPIQETIVARKNFCQLKHFERPNAGRHPRMLVVAPLSGHYATLLRGTVEALLPDHDVYITDWRDARMVPVMKGHFDLDDYIDYVIEFLQVLGPDTHVMAVCQPSVPVLAAVALMAEAGDPCAPASMTLMGGPIDTRRNPTQPCKLAEEHSIEWFENSVVQRVPFAYPGFLRRVYPGFLQLSGFMAMNLDRHVDAHMQFFQHLVEGDGESADKHREFYNEYRSVMDLPAEYYLQTVEAVFQRQALAKGELTHRGHRVDTGAIEKTALMTVEGELDDISGVGQTQAAHDICTRIPDKKRVHFLQEKVGHYGVFNGSRWRTSIYPRIREFVKNNVG
ncbi:polyhydroxyalkanoate depolymerase [Oceanibacterium hippocampi]|uniref:PHB de-polymerase C-terminal domain-containing protein n=1 Tax=Oceanibacterium hippocampi TaxID=745714 RepID=A0A1Y5RNC4_9PROT|nr:polyhydroxyalkanoate depolymerase [Oceanibacterium hippocampi]SLN21400.1 hypothetical protein OCH7691_00541 [Oceanibacterium hippocampi]